MASSSPASIRSQAHDLSPTQLSAQEFRSQVPFHTQLPYDRSPFDAKKGEVPPQISKSTQKHVSQHNETSAESQDVRTSRSGGTQLEGREPLEAQQPFQAGPVRSDALEKAPPVPVLGGNVVEDADEDGDKDQTASSDGSIECEPLGQPIASSAIEEDPADLPVSRGQPFPLVEWIRRIREESKPEWPTSALQWSRSISKRQKAILDADDAWFPPLPGRPTRKGTIPIDILNTLTRQVDQDAEARANKELQPPGQKPRHRSELQASTLESRRLPSSPPSEAPVNDDDVLWSSSPPSPRRRVLPPDTSPPCPASQQQHSAVANECPREARRPVPTAKNNGPDSSPNTKRSPPDGSNRNRTAQSRLPVRPVGDEGGPSVAADRVEETRLISRANPPTSPAHAYLPSKRATQVPKTISRPAPRIQVKDTPYPFKRANQHREQYDANDDLPQSSLVAATYPDAAIRGDELGEPHERESSPAPEPSLIEVIVPHTGIQSAPAQSPEPVRQLKRSFSKVDQQASNTAAGPGFPHSQIITSMSGGADVKSSRKPLGYSANQSPSSSECKAEEELRLRNKERLDLERLEKRRAFRTSISTRLIKDGVKHGLISNPQATDENNKAVSAGLSSPKSHGLTLADSRSECERTSATNLSLHDTSRSMRPPSRNISRQTFVQFAVSTRGLEEMFQSFVRAYPDYMGGLKNFESALRLLVKLDSKPREPHPSLWDDFVFRMSNDYKSYLQECIDECESALPYQDFYHTHVEQTGHRSGIITREGLRIVTCSATKSPIPRKRSSSNLLGHADDVVMIDADTPNPHPSSTRTTRSKTNAVQVSRDNERPARADAFPTSQAPNKAPSRHLSAVPSNIEMTRKRRSMPWSSNRSALNSAVLQTQQILVSSGEQTSTASAVEQWLSRPAGASSPEIASTQIQPFEQQAATTPLTNANPPQLIKKKTVGPIHVEGSDLSRLRLPSYFATPDNVLKKDTNNESPETPSDITPFAERPVTPFTLFARNFANLQSEKILKSQSGDKKRLSINVYEW